MDFWETFKVTEPLGYSFLIVKFQSKENSKTDTVSYYNKIILFSLKHILRCDYSSDILNIVQVLKIPGTFECAAINPIFIEEKGATFIVRTLA